MVDIFHEDIMNEIINPLKLFDYMVKLGEYNNIDIWIKTDDENTCFTNTLLHIPDDNSFFSSVIAINEKNDVIKNSNAHLLIKNFRKKLTIRESYEERHKIFWRIAINVERLILCRKYGLYKQLTGRYISFISPFYKTNPGHDLSIILSILDKIHQYKYDKILIMKDMLPFTKKILDLYFTEDKYEILDAGVAYRLQHGIFPKTKHLHLHKYKHLTDDIIKIVCQKLNNRDDLKGLKLITLKTALEHTVNTKSIYFTYKTLSNIASAYNYKVILPEKTDPYELIYMLYHATYIITQRGAISYANYPFYNPKIKIIYYKGGCYPDILKRHHVNYARNIKHLHNILRSTSNGR